MVLGKLPVPVCLGAVQIWIIVCQVPPVLAIGAVGGVWTVLLLSIISFFFRPLWETDTD